MSNLDLFGNVSTLDDGQRSDFDFYETPGWMTRTLLHWRPDIRGQRVLEVAAGRGAIARVLRDVGCQVYTNDIDPRHTEDGRAHDSYFDATMATYWAEHAPPVDWVISNFPFDIAHAILVQAACHANVAVVLRKTFLEPTDERGPWLQQRPPTQTIALPRWSFRGKGSDSVSSDWMIWEQNGPTQAQQIVVDYVADRR